MLIVAIIISTLLQCKAFQVYRALCFNRRCLVRFSANNENNDTLMVSIDQLKEFWQSKGFEEDEFSTQDAVSLMAMEVVTSSEDTFDILGTPGNYSLSANNESSFSPLGITEIEYLKETFVAENTESSMLLSTRSVGIDLGTTNSVVSAIEGGRPRVITIDGERVLPSVVAYLADGRVLVGEAARRQAVTNPQNTFASIKRIIGRTQTQLEQLNDVQSLNILSKSPSKKPALIKCPNKNGGTVEAPEISSLVLRRLLDTAEAHLACEPIKKAVVTVPAYFAPSQCDATEQAARQAGLEKVKLLREPEAAALAYGLTKKGKQIVLVFDLGGGTFDVSVLDVGDEYVEVIATSGDANLGGDDMDVLVQDWIVQQCVEEWTSSSSSSSSRSRHDAAHHRKVVEMHLRSDMSAMVRIKSAAEAAKISLSRGSVAVVDLPLLAKSGGGDALLGIRVTLTRRKFESLIQPVLRAIARPLREVALMAGVNLQGESGLMGGITQEYEALRDEDEGNDGGETCDASDVGSKLSLRRLRDMQTEDRRAAKVKKKVAGKTRSEVFSSCPSFPLVINGTMTLTTIHPFLTLHYQVRRLRSELGDATLNAFPGGQALDDIILVGGATRIPAVRRLVRSLTGIEPKHTVNPDEAVSLGASVLAGIMDGDIKGMQVQLPMTRPPSLCALYVQAYYPFASSPSLSHTHVPLNYRS